MEACFCHRMKTLKKEILVEISQFWLYIFNWQFWEKSHVLWNANKISFLIYFVEVKKTEMWDRALISEGKSQICEEESHQSPFFIVLSHGRNMLSYSKWTFEKNVHGAKLLVIVKLMPLRVSHNLHKYFCKSFSHYKYLNDFLLLNVWL